MSPASVAPAVIFVCSRNAVRSPMAEALWRARFGARARAVSCGVAPASLPDGHMIAVMDEIGVDLSDYECRDMDDVAGEPADLVVCLSDDVDAQARAFAKARGAAYRLWPVDEPAAGRDRFLTLASYRAARDAIGSRILAFEPESGAD
ncbi:MAG: low molecular weight phosphatase family protein [Oceanicaulis sp.]